MDENQRILECFRYVLPFINDLLVTDVSVSLIDREKFLLYKPGRKLDLKVKAGDPIKQGSAVWTALTEKRRIVTVVDKAVFGQPFIAVALPIYNSQKEIIGVASIQEAIDRQEELKAMANNLNDKLSTLASTSEEISAQAQEISANAHMTVDAMRQSQAKVLEMGTILGLIDNIARQSNLLGLNAAIESARAGESGRGFGVVADEIRKLAAESSASVRKIEDVIRTVQQDSLNANEKIGQIYTSISQVSEAIGLIASAVQEISGMAQKLDGMADALSRDVT